MTTRQRTLESMLTDSRRFEQLYIDTDRWIMQMSQRCQHDDIGNDVATVKQQKDIVEVFIDDFLSASLYFSKRGAY